MTKEEKLKAKLEEAARKIQQEMQEEERQKMLEEAFRVEVEKFHAEMREAQAAVTKAIQKTEDISEKYGIPFQGAADIMQNYTPSSLGEKWGSLSRDVLSDLAEAYPHDWSGWEASAFC